MRLSGLHLILTYRCTQECDHCFVWGGPDQTATLTRQDVESILSQARDISTIEWVYFEGGEPFLHYPVLVHGARTAHRLGFRVGLVTNAYWASSVDDAELWLEPFAGILQDLSLSEDRLHGGKAAERNRAVREAARRTGIPIDTIRVAGPGEPCESGAYEVMFRGRAAKQLVDTPPKRPWATFDRCPYENLAEPSRVHVDPAGHVHVCQGISMGNLFETPLRDLVKAYDPAADPVLGPLIAGGPAELARAHDCRTGDVFADACHLCYTTRERLRARYPEILAPDPMYGVITPV